MKMIRSFNHVVAMLVMMLLATTSAAQFGGLTGGSRDSSGSASVGDVVKSYTESQGHVLDAQVHLAEAFDLQDHVTLLKAEREALASGGLDGEARAQRKEVSDNASKVFSDVMAEEPELSAESKAHYAKGLVSYAQGLYHAKQTMDKAGNVRGGAGMAMSAEARQGMAIAREAPEYFRGLQGTTTMLMQYARRNNIEIPADATSMLDSL